MECLKCGSKNVTIDECRAEIFCEECGVIGELSYGGKDTEFEEMENGRTVAVGNIVATGQFASKQVTIKRASSKINDLCAKLFLTKCTADKALAIFKSALCDGITRGRNSEITIGACIYLASRISRQTIMLLDISDKVGVNVYTLGKFYKELKKKTGQNISDIDPALFIERFASELELGDQLEEVMSTSLKILQRMKKDWISTGRRPNSITAAALLIGSRLHGFDRDAEDLSKIAGISKFTTLKRIQEWAQTSTSDLTMDQFNNIEYEDEYDPPSFINQKEVKVVEKMSTEDFEILKKNVFTIQKQLNEKEEKLTPVNYEALVVSIDNGECDIEGLIGALDSDNEEDKEIEFDGRVELLGECVGISEALSHLKKKEVLEHLKESTEDKLPLYFDDDNNEGVWVPEDNDDIDSDELEKLYICSKDEALAKFRWWTKQNKDYYKKQKKCEQKRFIARKLEEEKGKKKKVHRRKSKRECKFGVDKDELIRDLEKDPSEFCKSPPLKKRCIVKDNEKEDEDEVENKNQETLKYTYEDRIDESENDNNHEEAVTFDYIE